MSTDKWLDKALESIHESTLLQSVINAIPAPVFFKDAKGRYLGGNSAFEEFVGRRIEDMVGRGVYDLWDKDLAKVYDEADRKLFESGGRQVYEAQVEYADGSIRDVMFYKAVFHAKDDGVDGIVGVMLDITERKAAEEKLKRLAMTDSLTDLPNRAALYQELDHGLKRAKRQGSMLAVMVMDLDGFKAVNDTYGHHVGDDVLREVAGRIRASIREVDSVGRLGGDEFVVVAETLSEPGQSRRVAQGIISAFADPFVVPGGTAEVGTGIGIAIYPRDGETEDALLVHADAALYRAKARGRNQFAFHDRSLDGK